MTAPTLFLELGQASLKAWDGDATIELPLEREETGRLTPSCRERLSRDLREFLRNQGGRQTALCAIGARGVSLRRLSLPPTAKEEFDRLLLLQIESEFPLPPEELAWGSLRLPQSSHNGAPPAQELLIAAIKKDLLQDYSAVLGACGLQTTFTIAALARAVLCAHPPPNYGVLDIGRHQSELITFENGVPSALRIIPWGGETVTRAIESASGLSREQAEQSKIQGLQNLKAIIEEQAKAFVSSLKTGWAGQKLYLSGKASLLNDLSEQISKSLAIPCESLQAASPQAASAALRGLETSGSDSVLILQTGKARAVEETRAPAPWKWAALAGCLLVALLLLRFGEALWREKQLKREVATINKYREQLPVIDREFNFLQFLQTNQPPYMDAILTIANAMPGGLRIDSLSMNRRGEISLKGSMRDSQQVIDFRTKMVDSGFYSTVVVDEQSPTPDRQKVNYRISAQWKPLPDRKSPPTPESQPAKASGPSRPGTQQRAQQPPPPVPPH